MIVKLLRNLGSKTPSNVFRMLMNIWLPYRGAGIKILEVAPDYRYVKVCLKKTWYNGNYVGTQFGGSIYSMTDPFFMLMFMNNLGSGYYVWDKGATIDFVSPGKTALTAEFRITQEMIDGVIAKTASGEKYIFDLDVTVVDADKNIVATVSKKIYARKKKPRVDAN